MTTTPVFPTRVIVRAKPASETEKKIVGNRLAYPVSQGIHYV